MKFRTEIKIPDAPIRLKPGRHVLCLGSCFADNIGRKIQENGFKAVVNPCGVAYNPVSIALLIQLALTHRAQRRLIVESSVTEREGKFVSWFMDSKSAGDTKENCVDNISERLDILEQSLEQSELCIITFGTPDVWLLKGTDRAVGNCHKHPASEFEKRRLQIEEIAETWKAIAEGIRLRNPEMKFVFTVSPRRYLAEGFADNSLLKATLLLACERICAAVSGSLYFPAYEIMIDDLRDYRFYDRDMLHPSPMAIDYIWEKFVETVVDEVDRKSLKEAEKESRRSAHRPIL